MGIEERVYIATYGICCSVCGPYLKGICLPCGSGLKKAERAQKKETELLIKSINKSFHKI